MCAKPLTAAPGSALARFTSTGPAATILVFVASLTILGWNAGAPGIATAYVDPIGEIQAQDEALYGASSLEMSRAGGDWLTPRFLGRYALYKPPVLYWLSAISAKAGAPPAWAFRIPSLLAGAATTTLIFAWLRMSMPLSSAFTGVILLLSSHFFFVMSRTGLTDALLTFEIVVAIYALARDPRLESGSYAALFGCASGAAIMTKSTAGLFPLLILTAFFAISRDRPSIPRLLRVVAITAAVALPWHLWQLAVHPRWFWNEYILTEQLSWGLGATIQSTQESHAGYYLKRLLLLDPVLAIAVIALLRAKSRFKSIRLPLVWIAIILLGCAAFQYRNTSYLLPVYPALALIAANAFPKRFSTLGLAAVILLFVAKAFVPDQPWGIPFEAESINPAQTALDAYASLRRGNDLILVEPDDQLYAADLASIDSGLGSQTVRVQSSDLSLAHVRYCYLDPHASIHAPLDLPYLGISVTAEEFARLPELQPIFAQRLHEWGLDSGNPIATVILARDDNQIQALIAAHPEDDFFAPTRFISGASHDLSRISDHFSNLPGNPSGRVFLLSREKIQRP